MNTPNTPPPPGSQPPPPGSQPPPQQYPPQQYPAQPGAYPQQPAAAPPPGYQPGGYQQPGYAQPPFEPQPKKKSKWWIWVLVVLFLFAVLIGACGVLVFKAAKGPIDKSNEFLALLEDGEVDDATDLLDFDCFSNDEIDDLEQFFTDNPVTDYDLTGTSNTNGRGGATGTVTLDDGFGSRPISFDLTNDDGWQVCGIDIDAP